MNQEKGDCRWFLGVKFKHNFLFIYNTQILIGQKRKIECFKKKEIRRRDRYEICRV